VSKKSKPSGLDELRQLRRWTRLGVLPWRWLRGPCMECERYGANTYCQKQKSTLSWKSTILHIKTHHEKVQLYMQYFVCLRLYVCMRAVRRSVTNRQTDGILCAMYAYSITL